MNNKSDFNNNSIHQRKVVAIISDYDGTLIPTNTILNRSGKNNNRIPERLEKVLSAISEQVPVCILPSKDYGFLYDKVPFASIISCILGVETLVVSRNGKGVNKGKDSSSSASSNTSTKILSRHLLASKEELAGPSRDDGILSYLADAMASLFPEVEAERKFTSDGLLVGITFDWRNQSDEWSKYSSLVPTYVREMLSHQRHSMPYSTDLELQTYNSHPFIDIYAVECNKGMGFDCIVEELSYHRSIGSILYLGDSENDNSAFEKAGISVGVVSDVDMNSGVLDCDYIVDYDDLADFLEQLMNNNFVLSDDVLKMLECPTERKRVER
jgi:hydroxymethylpyrimidine pyrophosphatase-like HAD family hydrolase